VALAPPRRFARLQRAPLPQEPLRLPRQDAPGEDRVKITVYNGRHWEIQSFNPACPDPGPLENVQIVGILVGWFRSRGWRETMDSEPEGLMPDYDLLDLLQLRDKVIWVGANAKINEGEWCPLERSGRGNRGGHARCFKPFNRGEAGPASLSGPQRAQRTQRPHNVVPDASLWFKGLFRAGRARSNAYDRGGGGAANGNKRTLALNFAKRTQRGT